MIINKMNIERDKLNISVSISCPFDIDVTSPKCKKSFLNAAKKIEKIAFSCNKLFQAKAE